MAVIVAELGSSAGARLALEWRAPVQTAAGAFARDLPSIAVLPFTTMFEGPEQTFLGRAGRI